MLRDGKKRIGEARATADSWLRGGSQDAVEVGEALIGGSTPASSTPHTHLTAAQQDVVAGDGLPPAPSSARVPGTTSPESTRTSAPHRRGSPSNAADDDPVDAWLIIPNDVTAQRYARLLASEGYRVHVAASPEEVMGQTARVRAEIAFIPEASVGTGRSRETLRQRLAPLVRLGIPIVALGPGWERRMREAAAPAPQSGPSWTRRSM